MDRKEHQPSNNFRKNTEPIMPIKLSRLLQLEQLGIGDKLRKFPIDNKPEDNFDWNRKKEINTYEIRAINHKDGTWKLVQVDDAVELFTWPGDIEYVNIGFSTLIAEKVWWIMES